MKILDKILGGVFPTNKRLTTDDTQVDNEIQNVIRAAGLTPTAEVSLTGTSSSVGTAITGVGTLFLSELKVGDLFYKDSAQNDLRRVTNIASDLALTVESAFASDFSGQACSIFNVTQLNEAIATSILSLYNTSSIVNPGYSRIPVNEAGVFTEKIEQWGRELNIPATTQNTINLPITFPNTILNGTMASQGTTGVIPNNPLIELTSTSQIKIYNGHSSTLTIYWKVLGN